MRINPSSAIRSISLPAWSATVLALGLLSAIAAYWSVVLLAPRAPIAPAATLLDDKALPELQQASLLFGSSGKSAISPAIRNIKVLGIVAAGERGSAILVIDDKEPRAFAVGETLSAGRVLREVRSDAVVIDNGGQRLEVPTPQTASLAVLTSGPNQPDSGNSEPPGPVTRAVPARSTGPRALRRAPRSADSTARRPGDTVTPRR